MSLPSSYPFKSFCPPSAYVQLQALFACGPALVLVITCMVVGADGKLKHQTSHRVTRATKRVSSNSLSREEMANQYEQTTACRTAGFMSIVVCEGGDPGVLQNAMQIWSRP